MATVLEHFLNDFKGKNVGTSLLANSDMKLAPINGNTGQEIGGIKRTIIYSLDHSAGTVAYFIPSQLDVVEIMQHYIMSYGDAEGPLKVGPLRYSNNGEIHLG